MWTHIFAVVGYCVVDGKRVQWWDKSGVAIGHACESHLIGLGVAEFGNNWLLLATDTRIEWFKETQLLESLTETTGVAAIFLDNELCHANVARHLYDLTGRQSRSTVRVIDFVFTPHRASGDWCVDIAHDAVFKCNHHRDGFHDRTGLVAKHGVVHTLVVVAAVALQVGDGLDFACGDFHEHAGAPFGVGFFTNLVEFIFHDVLHLHVDSRGDVIAGNCWCAFPVDNLVGQLNAAVHAGHTIEQ